MKKCFLSLSLVLAIFAPLTTSFADGILNIPADDGVGTILPLVGVTVSVEISNQAAITTVRNSFQVEGEDTIATVYYYRLPPSASVTGFGVWQGDSLAMFDLRPGQQGGHDTSGFGEQNSDLKNSLGDNPFVIGLRSTPPGVFMTELRYVQLLDYDFGVVEYAYPLNTGEYLRHAIDTISITGTYESQREVLEVSGNYEQYLQIEPADQYNGSFSFEAEDYRPQEDLILKLNYNQEDIGAWLLTHRTNAERSGYFMLIIDPGIVDTSEAVTKNFTFVIDCSGSMGGDKIVQARRAVLRCLDNLFPRDYFSIIDFDSNVRRFRQEMVPADGENLQAARNYVSAIRAGGSTNIYDALMAAVGQEMAEGAANQIIFATDGAPTAGPSTDPVVITRDVTEANQFHARIFSFGIGEGLNVQFLNALSEANNGEAIIFDPVNAPIDEIVDDFYTRQARPALINPVVEFSEELETDSLFPPRLQNVAAGNQLYVFGRYSSFGEFDLSLSGRMPAGDTTLNFERFAFLEEEAGNEFVPRLWAKSAIDYYLKWMLIHGEDDEIIAKIIELSLEYGILTKYTGFVDPNDPPPPDDSGQIAVQEPDLTQFTVLPTIDGAELTWTISGVTSVIAFNVYKAPTPAGPWQRLNESPLSSPRFVDAKGRPGDVAYYRIEVLYDETSWHSEPLKSGAMPSSFALTSIHPNPFNGQTVISFSVGQVSKPVHLAIYDLSGRLVADLVTGKNAYPPGEHKIVWNAETTPAGVYLVKLTGPDGVRTSRMALVR